MGVYTKKVGSIRCMKKIEDWYGLNKSTPDQWFKRWEQFLVPLMEEIGYRQQTNPPIQKKRGKAWTKELTFTHPSLENTTLFLSRKRRQQGGKIHFVYGLAYDAVIDTTSPSKSGGYDLMSRQKVGEAILNHVREGWSKSKKVED